MYVEDLPPPSLAGRVVCVWRQESASPGTHLVVPDGCVDLIWGPSGPHVAGPDTGPMPTPMRVGDAFVGIRFGPGTVGSLFGVPVEALRDLRVPVSDLPALVRLAAWDARSGQMRVLREVVEARLRETPSPDPAGTAIAGALLRGASVREVAWELGFSARQLHRRSLGSFGYAPKTLQRIVRFQRALRLARAGVPLSSVAAESGYADQAHLANDVKRLSGVSMRHLLGRA